MRIPIKHHGKAVYMLIDDADAELLEGWTVSVHSGGYALARKRQGYADRATGKKRPERVYVHRLILRPSPGFQVDHINGNKLDNRRANLRVCTSTQNLHNCGPRSHSTHGVRGVALHKRSGLWQARISFAGRRYDLGYFDTIEEASAAYQKAAHDMLGDFSFTGSPNHPRRRNARRRQPKGQA